MSSEASEICALCKIFSSGNLLYVRESETLICNDRHLCEDTCYSKDDNLGPNSYQLNTKNNVRQNRRSRSELTLTVKDNYEKKLQFGGDGDKNIICLKKSASRDNLTNEIKLKNTQNHINIPKPTADNEIAVIKTGLVQSSQDDDNLETTLMYRNTKFRESCNCSSTCTLLQDITNDKCFFSNQTTESVEDEENTTQRPLLCPIAECYKMLTTNSIFSHFHFDHPNIPIINLDRSITLTIKMNKLTSQKRCLAVLLPSGKKNEHGGGFESTTPNYKKPCPLLLMGVRVMRLFHDLKSEYTKGKNEIFPEIAKINKEIYETESNYEIHPNTSNYALLLWLCSIENDAAVYTIQVTSEDKKFSRNCISPAFNLRDGDICALSLFESLIIQGAAVNFLCGNQDHIVIVVQTVD